MGQHPAVFLASVKEPHYFCYQERLQYSCGPGDRERLWNATPNLDAYEALFADAAQYPARGEASTTYLDSGAVPGLIRDFSPDARIIVLLRNPVDRAYASYMHLRRDGVERYTDFADALVAEPDRIRNKFGPLWHYKTRQFTYEKLKRYYEKFPKDRIRVYLYDEWKDDNLAVLADIFAFLDVDPAFRPDVSVRENIGGVPKSELLHQLAVNRSPVKRMLRGLLPHAMRLRLRKRVIAMNLERPKLSPELRGQLKAEFRDDVLKVQDLINKDLSAWL
jgi:hypothetical protein